MTADRFNLNEKCSNSKNPSTASRAICLAAQPVSPKLTTRKRSTCKGHMPLSEPKRGYAYDSNLGNAVLDRVPTRCDQRHRYASILPERAGVAPDGTAGYEYAHDIAARRRMQDLGKHVLRGIDLLENPDSALIGLGVHDDGVELVAWGEPPYGNIEHVGAAGGGKEKGGTPIDPRAWPPATLGRQGWVHALLQQPRAGNAHAQTVE